jgi:hypothetical protein
MDERPQDPTREREIVERHEIVERDVPARGTAGAPPPAAPRAAAGTPAWLWVIPLLVVVIGLIWYVLSTGQRREGPIDLPSVEVPSVQRQAPTQRVEVGAPAPAAEAPPQAEPAPQPDPAPAPEPPPAGSPP